FGALADLGAWPRARYELSGAVPDSVGSGWGA
ncbi:MAG: hypothetical protein ACI9BK_000283, partial [Acidimicrobiales bacterium]